MDTNKYELRDYPCLYYLSNKLDRDAMCKFFTGLGTMFGLTPTEISRCSLLFSSATKILFNGKGFSEEEILNYSKSVLNKPFSGCNSLCKWNIVKQYEVAQNCCIGCPLSKEYKNARLECEQMNLRAVIHTGRLSGHESNKFMSVVSIKSGNDISEYPYIPLYSMLNQYFIENNTNMPYDDMMSLISSFSEYVCSKMNYTDKEAQKAIYECVKREINHLYDFDFSLLTNQVMHTVFLGLVSAYEYKPPKIMTPVADESPEIELSAPVKKKENELLSASDQLKIIAVQNQEEKRKNDDLAPQNKDKGSSDLQKEEKNNSTKEQTKNNTECIHNEYNINAKYDNEQLDKTSPLPSCLLTYPDYSVSDDMIGIIRHCTSDDPKAVLDFITDICSSRYVCIESVILKSRHGLLMMTGHRQRFYFFDLEYSPSGYLYPIMADASNMKFLSLNPIPVISMFRKIGFNALQIESLCGLYWIYKNIEIIDYKDIFFQVLSLQKDNQCDFYRFYMPYYERLYNEIIAKINEENLKKYKKGKKLEQVLGKSYDLSDILYGLSYSVSGQGFFNYQFNYSKNVPFIKKGILYVITLPELKDEGADKINEMLEDIAIKVHHTPVKADSYSRLITFLNYGLEYFSTMQGDIFLDVLLDAVRSTYMKYYKNTPLLKTYRVEYK